MDILSDLYDEFCHEYMFNFPIKNEPETPRLNLSNKKNGAGLNKRPICAVDNAGNVIKRWNSHKEVCSELLINSTTLSKACVSGQIIKGFRFYNEDFLSYANFPDEIWKLVPLDIKPLYVSNYGRFRTQKNRILKPQKHGSKLYIPVTFNDGKTTGRQVDMLIAAAFSLD